MAAILERRNLCGFVIDCTLSESHSKSARVTTEPVSSGVNISDHMYSEEPSITLVGIIQASPSCDYSSILKRPTVGIDNFPLLGDSDIGSNTPLTNEEIENNLTNGLSIDSIDDFEENLVASLGISHFGSKASRFTNPEDRLRAAWIRLLELMDNKEVCDVVTGLQVYKDVVVTRISAEQDVTSCEHLQFSLTIQKIKRVEAQNVSIESIETNKGVSEKGKVNPKCLRLNEVFNLQDGTTSNTLTTSITEIQNGQLITANFDRTVWEQNICGKIGARYTAFANAPQTQNALSIEEILDSSGLIGYQNALNQGIIQENSQLGAQTNSQVADLTDKCQALLSMSGYQSSCDIPTRCRDKRFQRDEESANNGQSSNNRNSTTVTSSGVSSRFEAVRSLFNEPEVIAEDPTSQYAFLNGGNSISTTALSNSFVITNFSSSDVQSQVDRINCYRCAVLSDLASGQSIYGATLRQIGFQEIECSDSFTTGFLAPNPNDPSILQGIVGAL